MSSNIFSNSILATDSYKASHFLQFPAGMEYGFSYASARRSRLGKSQIRFFGLQYFLKAYLSTRITMDAIDEAESYILPHGEPFNRAGWERIVREFDGKLPLRVRAVSEGALLPLGVPLVTFENTAPGFGWLPGYIEGAAMESVWYGTTVATLSWEIRELIRGFLEETADDTSGLPFKLHDFGFRGASSRESAALGGTGHLLNFLGTDTLLALALARNYYGEAMAGFSIPASEHSTITSWGRENEFEAFRNMVNTFGGPGKIYACVADSYDIERAVTEGFGGVLREEVLQKGGTLVVRPDSGYPEAVSLDVVRRLDAAFGTQVNSKGYRVLNNVRVIYGDGINLKSIRGILLGLKMAGYSADNIAFGMGSALLQEVARDDFSFAIKTSAICVDGVWRDVYKDPVTDSGKRSMAGRLATLRNLDTGRYAVVRADTDAGVAEGAWEDAMRTVFENGEILVDDTLAEIRARA